MANNPLVSVLTILAMFIGGLLVLTGIFSPSGADSNDIYLYVGIGLVVGGFVIRFTYMLTK